MENSPKLSTFGKLKFKKYLIIEMLMNLEYIDALSFLWKVNKEGREFLFKQIVYVKNGFVNEGLIVHTF